MEGLDEASLPLAEFVRAGELLTRIVHRACVQGAA